MYIACDIGGTKTRIAGSTDLNGFDEPVIEETPDNPEDGLKLIVENAKKLAGEEKIDGICVGIAGVLNQEHEYLIKSPHLNAWEKVPIKEFLSKELDTNVYLENDTDLVGLGEATDGAGKGKEIVVYITISTGVGGVKIVKGSFVENRFGFEPGFLILNNETLENFEDLCSGTAVEKKFGMHPKEVAKTDDWQEIEKNICVGLHNCILTWSPDVLVVGGSMSKDLDADRLKKGIGDLMKIHPSLPEIKIAELGSTGGLNGGFAFIKSRINS